MTRRIVVALPDEAEERLTRLAIAEMRPLRQQAAFLILRGLGLQPPRPERTPRHIEGAQ